MSAVKTQIIGGGFQDLSGNPLANGVLTFELSNDGQVNGDSQLDAGRTVSFALDADGNLITNPPQYAWANDVIVPANTFYIVSGYSASGQLVYGPCAQQVLSTPSPYNIGAWVPGEVNLAAESGFVRLNPNDNQQIKQPTGTSLTLAGSLAVSGQTGYMYANGSSPVSASTTIPAANVSGLTFKSLTTTGTSGAATLAGGVLNIPNYAGGVTSVFGRSSAVVAVSGDYTAAQVTNAADVTAANTFTANQTIQGTTAAVLSLSNPSVAQQGSYVELVYTGSGTGARNWVAAVGNGQETARGLAGKYFIFDNTAGLTRAAFDSAGSFGIGYATPQPSTYPALLSVGTSAQFQVTSSGAVTAPTINGAPISWFGLGNANIGGSLPSASSGNDNTATGNGSLASLTSGTGNAAFGATSLTNNTTGAGNAAFGYGAMSTNSTGDNNTAVGFGVLSSNTSGSQNVAIGENSLPNNTSGSFNTSVGNDSLFASTTADYNVAVGMEALHDNTTGFQNTAVGSQAGFKSTVSLSTISNSTFVGYQANSSTNGLTNMVVIGAGAEGTASNQVTLGNSSVTSTILRGTVSIGELSTSQTATASSTASDHSIPIIVNGTTMYMRLSSTP